jgi:thioredoxin reductase (NADPH)
VTVVVVGGGPAGVAAAVACARAGAAVILLEGLAVGGESVNVEEIAELPGQAGVTGPDFSAQLTEQVLAHEIDLRLGEEATAMSPSGGGFAIDTWSGRLAADAVIFCAGSEPIALPGRPDPASDPLLGRGLFICATCDGPLYAGKHVAIAGGGDTGVEAALTLSRYAARVVLYERELALTAQPVLVAALADAGNVDVRLGAEVTAASGDDQIEAVEVSGRGGSEIEPVEGLMLAVGLRPRTGVLGGLVELDTTGAIVVGPDLSSSAAGLFAAGDVRSGAAYRCASAFGDGLLAARGALAHARAG